MAPSRTATISASSCSVADFFACSCFGDALRTWLGAAVLTDLLGGEDAETSLFRPTFCNRDVENDAPPPVAEDSSLGDVPRLLLPVAESAVCACGVGEMTSLSGLLTTPVEEGASASPVEEGASAPPVETGARAPPALSRFSAVRVAGLCWLPACCARAFCSSPAGA